MQQGDRVEERAPSGKRLLETGLLSDLPLSSPEMVVHSCVWVPLPALNTMPINSLGLSAVRHIAPRAGGIWDIPPSEMPGLLRVFEAEPGVCGEGCLMSLSREDCR